MSRSFRIYAKKRGDRRTGSGALAGLGEAIFFGLFFLGGCAGLIAILATLILPQWRVNNEFVETTCVVRAKELGKSQGENGWVYRPEITIDYLVDGRQRRATTYDICHALPSDCKAQQAALERFEVGSQYRCWYDPLELGRVALVRGYSGWTWLLLVIPISFMLIGGGGFVYRAWHWGKSAEHRAATGTGPIKLRANHGNGSGQAALPTIPPSGNMSNSPGTMLRFRLPVSRSATLGLLVLIVVCVLWNLVAVFFVVDVVNRFMEGRPNWVETAVVVPLALVGLLLIYAAFRQLLIATGIGPTLVEISDHPLYPDGKYEVFLSQAGRLRLHSIELLLVGTEEVRYRQGTDTRTESRCVHRTSLFRRDGFEIYGGTPFEVRCPLEVPSGIMHSFKSESNAVSWSLVVDGRVAGWPDYRRSFPVVIYPNGTERADYE